METFRKVYLSLLSGFIFCITFNASGQYYDATHRQTSEEIQKFRNEHVKMMTISFAEGGSEVPFGVNYYDTSGQVILIANLKHHEHFSYNQNNKMVYWLDSANDGRRFEKFEYKFGYDAGNRIISYYDGARTSQFIYNEADATEIVSQHGIQVEKHIYTYTPEGKLNLEVFNDTAGKQIYFHKLLYNKYGDLSSEIIFNPIKRCSGDSTTTINTFDSKGRIIQKQNNITTFTCDLRNTNSSVTKKTISQRIVYNYDAKGHLSVETMTCSEPALNYKKEFQYSDEGLLTKELNMDTRGKLIKTLNYRYYYFIRKK